MGSENSQLSDGSIEPNHLAKPVKATERISLPKDFNPKIDKRKMCMQYRHLLSDSFVQKHFQGYTNIDDMNFEMLNIFCNLLKEVIVNQVDEKFLSTETKTNDKYRKIMELMKTDDVTNHQTEMGVYSGEIRNNKPRGKGSMTFKKSNDRYEGYWMDGKRHGSGEMIDSERVIWKGEWSFDVMNGPFVVKKSDGTVLYLEYNEGLKHGKCILLSPDKKKVEYRSYNDDALIETSKFQIVETRTRD